ncbi:reductase [Lithospermum erythrorhizon]|uniref:Reductase n=1 Tax=Lithospermum erythrorhizon TaxID=34254 RepID=A0AAV3NUQ2_LITER
MEICRIWVIYLAFLMIFGRPPSTTTAATTSTTGNNHLQPPYSVCKMRSVKEYIMGSLDTICPLTEIDSWFLSGVTEGGEDSLQKALNMVHKTTHDYVAILFYASWCPFSRTFRPTFPTLASFYPSIPHFAIEESSVRPSILSKYGVRGFPTLVLLNSTMRVRYSGSRTLDSLTTFYGKITGMKNAPISRKCLEKSVCLSDNSEHGINELGSCPFSWIRSPENLLRQETYLALATAFVLLRLMHIIFPALRKLFHFPARRYMNIRFRSFWDHLLGFLNRAVQLINSLKEPCKRNNLQEGAMNANAWASKSLATVLFEDASTSRTVPVRDINGS